MENYRDTDEPFGQIVLTVQDVILDKYAGKWGTLIKNLQDWYIRTTGNFLTRINLGRKNATYNKIFLQKGYEGMTESERSSSPEPYVLFRYVKDMIKKHPQTDPKLFLGSEEGLILASAIKPFIDLGYSDDEIEAALKKKPVNNSGYYLSLHAKAVKAQKISDNGGYNSLSDYMKSLIFIPPYAVAPPKNPQAVFAQRKEPKKTTVVEKTPEATDIVNFITNLIYNLT